MSDLSSLISRVEKATGPDRTIDVDVMNLLCPRSKDEARLVLGKLLEAKWGGVGEIANKTTYFVEAPRLTTSIDAAVSLAERVIPGRCMSVLSNAKMLMYERGGWEGHEVPQMLPRFIVLATLRAIQSQKGEA